MGARIKLREDISLETLQKQFAQERDGTRTRHLTILMLLKQGKTAKEVADLMGYSLDWIYRLCKRYNEGGLESLGDKRQNNGRAPTFTHQQEAEIKKSLRSLVTEMSLGQGLGSRK